MLSACANNSKIHEGFGPLVPGFKACEAVIDDLIESINESTAAVMLELVQSEGGVNIMPRPVLDKIISLCNKYEVLIFLDEVQTGFGRCAEMFGYQAFGVAPDIITCAKSIGNGFPLAACLMTEEVSQCITPGTHGGTYGGNPLACAVGIAVLDEFQRLSIVENVKQHTLLFHKILQELVRDFPNVITACKCCGFFGGLELINVSALHVMHLAIGEGLLITTSGGDKVIRILPPLIAQENEFEIFRNKMRSILSHVSGTL
jgi:acetylornithine aminotransferase/acetylornithine/N-succinyldiaminopimelate aminotransferase